MTIAYVLNESCADKQHYTFIVAPRHRDSSQNMITSALQADTAHITIPADSHSITAIAIDDHKPSEIQ